VSAAWKPEALWDLHTPRNVFEASVALVAAGKPQDTYFPVRFGFREFRIDGRERQRSLLSTRAVAL
jgi:hypothetical protein